MSRIVWLFIFCWPVALRAQQDTAQQVVQGRVNSPAAQQKPYVILISADGLRYDLVDKYNAVHLKQFRDSGVAATSMKPAFPSLTFPNHYTLITGLTPAHHGIVANIFFDRQKNARYSSNSWKAVRDSSWYGGTPLWVLAEQQQLLTAAYYWVGSETGIQGVRPTYFYYYNDSVALDTRVAVVKNWLTLPEEKRPHFIAFYIRDVDHQAHWHGADSRETMEAVHAVDDCVAKLKRLTDSLQLPVNYVFLSDHGMTMVDTLHGIGLPAAISDTTKFYVPNGDVLLHAYARDPKFIRPAYKALKKVKEIKVYLPTNLPACWQYNHANDRFNRLGDLILIPKLPRVFKLTKSPVSPGKHGFDNDMPDMQATFYAWGPAFKQGLHIPAFDNVHVYPLIAHLLGLTYTTPVDGNFKVLQPILK